MWRSMPTKTSIKRSRYERNIWREISSPNTFQEISLPKNNSKNSTKEALKRHSLHKMEDKSRPKSPSRDISLPKNLKKHLNKQKHLKRLSLPKKLKRTISQKKSLKRNLYHSLQRNPYQTNFRRNLYQRRTMPTKRSWDKSVRTKYLKRNL